MQEKPDPNIYVLCDYAATGEGRTVMTMVTRASPRRDDYVNESYIDENGRFHFDPTTKNTPEDRALKEFTEHFGDYYAMGAEVLDRVDFFGRVGKFVPEVLYKLTDPEGDETPLGFHWTGSFHYNYS